MRGGPALGVRGFFTLQAFGQGKRDWVGGEGRRRARGVCARCCSSGRGHVQEEEWVESTEGPDGRKASRNDDQHTVGAESAHPGHITAKILLFTCTG